MAVDTLLQSAYKGRFLAAIVCILVIVLKVFEIEINPEDEDALVNHLNELLLLAAAVIAIVSKYREKWAVEKEEKLDRLKEEVERQRI